MAGTLAITVAAPSPWYDTQNLASAHFNLVISSGTIVLEAANDDALTSKSDAVTVVTYTGTVSKTIYRPMPRFLRFRPSAGGATLSWGHAVSHKGEVIAVSTQGSKNSLSNELTAS